jgi:hypothetical protein
MAVEFGDGGAERAGLGIRIQAERGAVLADFAADGLGDARAGRVGALVGVDLHPARLRRLESGRVRAELGDVRQGK